MRPLSATPKILTNTTGTFPVAWLSESTVPRQLYLVGWFLLVLAAGCKPKDEKALLVARETFAELRVVKGQVTITEVGKHSRPPYPRERLSEGARLSLAADSLAYMRNDYGATWLLAGSTQAVIRQQRIELTQGKAFVDTQGGPSVTLGTGSGAIEVSGGRSSITVTESGVVEAYVLRGSLRHLATRASAGEMLTLGHGKAAETRKITSWTDWTSGLATADPDAQPAPYGIGTVGARGAGDQGKPRFSLVIQRLEVRVTIDHDYAQTEVDETFTNPSSDEVEGIFSFRVPETGVLHRFGVDRDGLLVWGKPQEKRTAAAKYQSNVYAGSTEDPALLEWVQRGVYQARLYPIGPGTTRRVVTRYGEWLARSGERGERRLYVYPMAATGAEGTLPRIEEMTIRVDWSKAQASRIRAPLGSVVRGKQVVMKAFDFLPKSDLALELFDAGQKEMLAYRAKHALSKADAPVGAAADFADKTSKEEADYVLIPLISPKAMETEPGIDLSIVVDSSAAMDSSALAVSRSLVDSLLSALGPTDRAALFAGDTTLRPVLAESGRLSRMDSERKKAWLAELSNVPTGGATDIGTLLAEAAERLEAKRRGAVIYVGDGRPSVGELLPKTLHDRLTRLPSTARVFAVGVGTQVNRALLQSLVRGAPLETVQNGYEAAQAALRLLEAASMPAWQNVEATLAGVDRVQPRSIPTVAAGEPALLVGRVAGQDLGGTLELTSGESKRTLPIRIVSINDDGDLRRRWGDGRLTELVEQHSGRIAIVDLARRYGLVTPWTSLYVATRREAEKGEDPDVAKLTPEEEKALGEARLVRWRPWSALGGGILAARSMAPASYQVSTELVSKASESESENKEDGLGTRAKGEEGSMGNPQAKSGGKRYSVAGPKDNPDPHISRAAALREAQQFGMTGLLDQREDKKASSEPAPVTEEEASATPASPPGPIPEEAASEQNAKKAPSGRDASEADEGLGLGSIGGVSPPRLKAASGMSAAPGAATGTGQSFGSGHGRLGGSHKATAAKIRLSKPTITANQPVESSSKVVRKPAEPVTPPPVAQVALPPIAQLSHEVTPCSPASDLPLAERRKLWRERLSKCSTAGEVREFYHSVIRGCEAPGWYERQLLLYGMVDQLRSVEEQVRLYQSFLRSPDYAAVVYRAILVRIQSAEALRKFQDVLGIKRASLELVTNALRLANDPARRVALLLGLVAQWPNDFELELQLLEAYEDAGDYAAARSLSRKLRRRADATAHVRTMVGEFYWRCSERGTELDKLRDLEEARRTFGEIVEFAPEDPAARRRLGDLLRSHGWYEEALRQYETLRDLLPDEPSVHLLIAAAAQGVGKTEEALRWSEKAAATSAPDAESELERAAQALGAACLAWAREDALKAGRQADAERLLLRGRKLASPPEMGEGHIRFILTWEHPELRPTLFGLTNAGAVPGRQIPGLGVAEQLAAKEEPRVEVRLDPEDVTRVARLGAEVVLTAIVAGGTPNQQSSRLRMRFGDVKHPKSALRVTYTDGALREEAL